MIARPKKRPINHKQQAEKALISLADQLHVMEQKMVTVRKDHFERFSQPYLISKRYQLHNNR